MKTQTALVLLAALTSAAAMGCSASTNSNSNGSTGKVRTSLHRSKNCGDLLSDLKADAIYKVNKGIDLQIESIQKCIARTGSDTNCAYGGYLSRGGDFGTATGAAENSAAKDSSATPSAPSGSGSAGGASPTQSPSASSYSQTNTQVKGVDEADFVKNDGKNIYLIHGRAFKVVNAWPAADLKESSTIDIEGTPSEMFVDGGKVVIYSQVNGASIYTASGVTPKDSYQDYMPYAGGGVAVSDARGGAPVASDPSTTVPGGASPYYPLTKITVLTLNGTTPSVAREMYFEGAYLDSRRVGTHVRTVLSGSAHGPKLKYGIYDLYPTPVPAPAPMPATDPSTGTGTGTGTTTTADPYPTTGNAMIAALEKLRAYNRTAIDASQLSDWTPYTFTKNGGAVTVSSVACEDFYVPTTGSTESGLTEVASIDLANPAALPRESAILGRAETVYGSADTIYLAAQAWVEPPYTWMDSTDGVAVGASGGGTAQAGTGTAAPATPPSTGGVGTATLRPRTTPTQPVAVTAWPTSNTHIHKFEFATDPNFPNYVASGTVVGNVKDQFSLDDKDGFLRIATSESRMYLDQDGRYLQPTFPGQTTGVLDRPQNVNHVFTLGVSGGWLDLLGDAGELAPNEQIYSVRFVGTRGYVVTFRRTDPLFVIDLTNPATPTKIAELTIPGFSEYMHPLGTTHLLTIGRAGTTSGQVQGLQLQIFDVTNGANPVVVQKYTYSSTEYGQSPAEHDHKAFTYFEEKQLLAFPYFAYAPASSTYGGEMRSSLEIFKVDTAAGFTKLGTVDETPLVSQYPNGYCGGYYGPQTRRGVFLENFVYAISYGGIVAKDVTNLASDGVSLSLPTPRVNDGYGPSCPEPMGL